MFDKISVIFNPISGGRNKKRILDHVASYCRQNSNACSERATSGPADATGLARKAVEEDADLVVVIGGDGTINEVASGMVGSGVPIAIIPTGSGNGLARSLGIPSNFRKACELLLAGKKRAIDVGKVNNRYFFLVAGVGFDAVVGKKFDELETRGPLSYFYAGAREFHKYKPETLQVNFDGHTLTVDPLVLAVANGQQYGNNAMIAPQALLDDGLLDICIIPPLSYSGLFNALPKLFNGKITSLNKSAFYKSERVQICRREPGYINLDGEPVFEGAHLEISVMPDSLNVMAPAHSPALSK